jgi:hypothetical protein
MRDVEIVIHADGKKLDSVKFSVLWVDKPTVRSVGATISPKNAKRTNYRPEAAGVR